MNKKSEDIVEPEIRPASTSSTETTKAGAFDMIELILAEQPAKEPAQAPPTRIEGIIIGQILSIDNADAPRVAFCECPSDGLSARTMVTLGPDDVGRTVALMFESGDPHRPVVLGRIAAQHSHVSAGAIVAESNGGRVEITSQEEIILRCGESSITLTRSGKIIIRGNYVLSRSSGVNSIQGGSVEIN